ncbi:nephrin-like isoform X2 [Babylonia areolata]|uniref:nephrin-like isoform X2 n=1 Tax=Babylonia areolata TaxID=304850 RepID=UPI003FD5705E
MTSCSMKATRHRWITVLLTQLFFIFCCKTTWAQWTQKPQDQMVGVGGTARFVCKSSNENQNLVWTKGSVVLFSSGVRFANVPDRYSLEDPFTLRISPVQRADNGVYGCNVPDFGSASANLTVLLPPGPPVITSDADTDVFEEGQTVRFTCSSTGGNPPPTITWMKNGMEMVSVGAGQTTTEGGTTRNVLTVNMDHSDHQANYTCFVYNQVNQNNSLTSSKILNVRYSPIITFVPFSPYMVRLGSMANITCQVDANPPATSITWQKDGQNIGTSFVKVFNPVKREDTGNYTCIASNSQNADTPTRSTVRVDVVYRPVVTVPAERNVPEFTQLTVDCDVDGNPSPVQIDWELVLPNGQRRQKSNSDKLKFAQIRREDAGNYSCKASSFLVVSGVPGKEAVFGQAFTIINVQYAPGPGAIAPIDNVDRGQRLQLTCTATPEGYPRAQYRWRINGAEQSQQGANYVIPSTTLSDSAVYSCTPFNIAGEGLPANISVSINEPPTLLQGLAEEITRTITNTQPLSLTCIGRSRPQPVIEWFKDNMTDSLITMPQFYHIHSSSKSSNTYSTEVTSTLFFNGSERALAPSGERVRLRIEDLGKYTCRVRSPVHASTASSTMQLSVQFAPVVSTPSQKIAVIITDQTYLPCQAQAYPPPRFQWYRDGRLINMASDKFSEEQVPVAGVPSGHRSTLVIHSVDSGDYGLYHCFVSNFLANVSTVVNITTKSTPESPTLLQTLGRTWESIHLQWTPGFNGGFPQEFQVTVQEIGSKNSYNVPAAPVSSSDYNITRLKPATRYEFSVFGTNELGTGQRSITITSQTRELDIPTLGDAVPMFYTSTQQLVVPSQPSAQYCLKIEAKESSGAWRTVKGCARLLGGGSLEIPGEGVTEVNVSVCLLARPDVCGSPTKAQISQPDNSPVLTVKDVIIIASVCAVIIITLLIILICFICRRRATAKAYENSGIPPPAPNGGIPGKKMQQGQGQSQSYDNAGMVLHDSPSRGCSSSPLSSVPVSGSAHANTTNAYSNGRYPTFGSSSEYPPNYWDSSSQPYDHGNNLSFDSQLDRQMYELELNRRNDMALYGRADGFRGQQESMGLQGRPMSPKDKYIDLEDPNDPSLQSQESGYSTGDPNKPKKVIYEVVV